MSFEGIEERVQEQQAGNEDPNAGGQSGGNGASGAQGNQPQAGGKTYTDSDFAAARRAWQYESEQRQAAAIQALRQEFQRSQQAAPAPQSQAKPQFDPQVEAALRGWFDQQYGSTIAQVQAGQIQADINIGVSQFQSQHPELSAADVNKVLEAALALGENVVNITPIDRLMQIGYLSYKFGNYDEKAAEKAAVDKYLQKKSATAASVARPQGAGAAVLGQKKAKNFTEAGAALEAMIAQADNT